MSIEVACPQCSTRLKAPDDSAGRKVRCKKCNNSFRIPGEQTISNEDEPTASAQTYPSANPFDFLGGSSPEVVETEVDEAPPPAKKRRNDPAPAPIKQKEPEPEPIEQVEEDDVEEELFTAPPVTQSGPPSMNPFSFEGGTAAPAPAPIEEVPRPSSRKNKSKSEPELIETDIDEPRSTKPSKAQSVGSSSPIILMALLTMMAMGLGVIIGAAGVYFLLK